MNDQTLSGNDSPHDTTGHPLGTPTPRLGDLPPSPQLEAILTLDEVMSSARLVERTARICLRGDLQAEYAEAYEELATLVDAEGQVVTDGDQALTDANRAEELAEKIRYLREQMLEATRRIRFRALPSDQWAEFEKSQRDAQGAIKDDDGYSNELIARCAIAPKLTVDDVKAMRSKLGPDQITALANAAYLACTTGGLDVPKSPSFLPAQKPLESSRS